MFSWFESRLNPYPPEEPAQPPEGLIAFCWHYTQSAGRWLVFMSVLTALISAGEVYLFGFLGNIIDWLSASDPTGFIEREGSRLIWMGVFLVVGLPLVVLLQSLLIHQTLLGNYPMIARWQMHRYLLRQSMNFFANEFAGRVATKVMQTSLAIRESVLKLLDVFVYVSVYFISMMVLVASSELRLMLPLLIWLVVYVTSIIYFVPKLKKVSREQADARSMMTGRVVDSYTNISTVKLFSHAHREAGYARQGMDDFLVTVHRQMRLVTLYHFLIYFNNAFLVCSISALSIWLWMSSVVSIGSIAIAIAMCLRINGMSQWIMWEISSLFENIGTVADGMKTLSTPIEVDDKENASTLTVNEGSISFENVQFNYGKAANETLRGPVINGLNLDIKPGEKIGLVGRSGAGKSTLVNLLLRFYDVDSGTISIDGQNIAEVSQESLRKHIAMVTQDTSLLHRSVKDNILYGRPDATEDEMLAAAKQAEAIEFIEDLEDSKGNKGFAAQVGERGVKLSGGQRQRIAIARVLLKDAPILILDEATSALDSEVEAAIQTSLDDLMTGKTVIAIAHRLSTIAQMDRLIVLDEGGVVEQGSHEQLIAQDGIYAALWSHQTGGFIGVE